MNTFRLLVAGTMLCALTVSVRADDKADNAKLIVGTWEVAKADKSTVPVESVFEFTNDGKLKVDQKEKKLEGTYKVEGDKLTFSVKVDGEERKRTITIKKISEKAMTTDDGGKVVEFTRKK